MDRLAVLKALGDNTRYAIYLEVARSPAPRSTSEVAETLGLHPNTVRPHLERMRDVGLLDVEIESRGSVGRPQHRYSMVPGAPSLGLEPPAFPLLARMLVEVAATAGAGSEEAAEIGREQGRAVASAIRRPPSCIEALVVTLEELGYDPAVASDDDGERAVIAFTHCPFQSLAEEHPELVCHLHRGLVEGFVEHLGGSEIESFGTLVDREPCQVALSAG